jgi:DNA-binding transcriptional ArsR family regulator
MQTGKQPRTNGLDPMTSDALEIVTARLRTIAEPMRVRLMWLLDEYGAATVQELQDRLPPTTRQNVSRHLGVLHQTGLVTRTRVGNTVRYELVDWTAFGVIEQIAASVAAHFEIQSERLLEGE